MVGPVGVQHPDLGQGGVPPLGPEMGAAAAEVVRRQGEAVFLDERREARVVQLPEALQDGDRPRLRVRGGERLILLELRLAIEDRKSVV